MPLQASEILIENNQICPIY